MRYDPAIILVALTDSLKGEEKEEQKGERDSILKLSPGKITRQPNDSEPPNYPAAQLPLSLSLSFSIRSLLEFRQVRARAPLERNGLQQSYSQLNLARFSLRELN